VNHRLVIVMYCSYRVLITTFYITKVTGYIEFINTDGETRNAKCEFGKLEVPCLFCAAYGHSNYKQIEEEAVIMWPCKGLLKEMRPNSGLVFPKCKRCVFQIPVQKVRFYFESLCRHTVSFLVSQYSVCKFPSTNIESYFVSLILT
jgi:hypothetical protein